MKIQGEVYYYLFSLSGFTDAVIETAKAEKYLYLIDIAKIERLYQLKINL